MSMITIEDQDFLIALPDLAALADTVGARANDMSLVPPGSGVAGRQEQVAAEFARLDPDAMARLTIALGVLRAPGKIADLHRAVADESIGRSVLAWSSGVPGTIVALAGSQDPRRITLWTQAGLTASLKNLLAAGDSLRDDEIGCKTSSTAAIVFLAALDHLRRARLYSLLEHAAPDALFSRLEIARALEEAASEDFRWPLLFAEKVIPGKLVTSLTAPEVDAALAELSAAGLIEPAGAGRYELSAVGAIIGDGVCHDVSKAVLGVTGRSLDGQYGRDVVLLIRSSFHLFLFTLAGQTAVIAAVSPDELAAALHFALRPVEPPAEAAAAPAEQEPLAAPEKQWHLIRGGQTEGPMTEAALRSALAALPPDTMVWNPELPAWATARDAGLVAAPPACPTCGAVLAPGQRFCVGCGRPYTSAEMSIR